MQQRWQRQRASERYRSRSSAKKLRRSSAGSFRSASAPHPSIATSRACMVPYNRHGDQHQEIAISSFDSTLAVTIAIICVMAILFPAPKTGNCTAIKFGGVDVDHFSPVPKW